MMLTLKLIGKDSNNGNASIMIPGVQRYSYDSENNVLMYIKENQKTTFEVPFEVYSINALSLKER